jgi:hypothetical protein
LFWEILLQPLQGLFQQVEPELMCIGGGKVPQVPVDHFGCTRYNYKSELYTSCWNYSNNLVSAKSSFWTMYRSGYESFSNVIQIVVDPTTVPGNVTGGSTICQGSASGLLTLAGHTGSVVRWESSVNGGATWNPIANTNTTFTSGVLAQTTWFRAVVQSGVCPEAPSTHTVVTVDPTTVGGTVAGGSTPICFGVNTGVMTLGGYTGTVLRWQKRVDGLAWTDIANTTTTFSEIPTASGTWDYRAEVQSGVCPPQFSAFRTIIVRPQFNLAQLEEDQSICSGASTNFRVEMTGGVSPFSITYFDGVGNTTINNYVSGANINTGNLFADITYSMVSATDANGCPADNLGTPITITGSGDACEGSSSFIRS